MHMWVLTITHGRMLSEEKDTPTLIEMEGVCYSLVPPTDWQNEHLILALEDSQVHFVDRFDRNSILSMISVLSQRRLVFFCGRCSC